MENDPVILQKDDLYNITVNTSNEYLDRVVRQVDLESAGSGYGKSEYYCPEGIPVETALFAVMGAAGLAFGVLFMAVTMITMPPVGRKKRRAYSNDSTENGSPVSVVFSDLIWEGMY